MKTLCNDIRAVIDPNTNKSKYIYTVQIDTDGAGQSAVRPYRPTDSSHRFTLTQAGQISQAFSTVGIQISKPRVAKSADRKSLTKNPAETAGLDPEKCAGIERHALVTCPV